MEGVLRAVRYGISCQLHDYIPYLTARNAPFITFSTDILPLTGLLNRTDRPCQQGVLYPINYFFYPMLNILGDLLLILKFDK